MANPDLVIILDYALRAAAIPIDGVSVGDPGNRATWRAQYSPSATPAQKTQGDSTLATIDVADAARLMAIIDAQAHGDLDFDKKIQAVAMALWENTPSPTMTKPQLKARVVAIYKTL